MSLTPEVNQDKYGKKQQKSDRAKEHEGKWVFKFSCEPIAICSHLKHALACHFPWQNA